MSAFRNFILIFLLHFSIYINQINDLHTSNISFVTYSISFTYDIYENHSIIKDINCFGVKTVYLINVTFFFTFQHNLQQH